jgi:hypothetical protein
VSAQFSNATGWTGVAQQLSAGLRTDSGFAIARAAGGAGLTVTRADGYAFNVEALASATFSGVEKVASSFALSNLATAQTVAARETTPGVDTSAAEVQYITLAESSLVAGGVYELTIGTDVIAVTVDASPTLAELATLLDTAINGVNGLDVGVAAVSTTGLKLTWDSNGAVSDTAALKITEGVVIDGATKITATETTPGVDTSAAEVQYITLAESSLVDGGVYELTIGTDVIVVTVDADATLAELATLLDTAINGVNGLDVGVAAVSTTGLKLTWDNNGAVSDTAILRTPGAAPAAKLSVDGSTTEVAVTDFTAAEVTGVTSSNLEETVQSLVSRATKGNLDTNVELQGVVTRPTQTITIDSIADDTVITTDFITSDYDGVTVTATLSAVLGDGERLFYSNNDGVSFVDVTSSVSGTAVSHADASLTSSATIKLKVVNAAGEETTPGSQAVTIDTTPPSAPSITQSGKTLTITGEAGATVVIFNGAVDVTTDFTITEISSGLYEAVAKPGIFDGTETVSLTAKLIDAAGNVSAASGAVTGAIDTTAPETTSSSFGFGTVLDYTEAGSNQTLSVLTSGVEDGETVTLTLNGKTYTETISSDAASIPVPTADLEDLASGTVTYTIDMDDAAGNSATQFSGSFVKNGISFAGIDVDGDSTLDFTDPSATAGTDGGADTAVNVVLDVSDAVANDVYELYIDGTLVNTGGTSITQTDINNGTVTQANVDISANNSDTAGAGVNANANEVLIEIKLKSGGTIITDGTDKTWDYQW